jgi:hypothetical protein
LVPSSLLDRLDSTQQYCFGLVPALHLQSATTPSLVSICDLDLKKLFNIPNNSHLRYLHVTSAKTRLENVGRILAYPEQRVLDTLTHLKNLVAGPSPPLSLHLPSVLRDADADVHIWVEHILAELEKTCEMAGVDLRWHDEEDFYAVSPSFWRYAKELQVRQGAAYERL